VTVSLPQIARGLPPLAFTDEIEQLLAEHQPVAIGISGGKDSDAAALAVVDHLDRTGHRGPRVLIHSDLGIVEWAESLPQCERLAKFLNMQLLTVRRKAGGLMERWETRWRNNVARYAAMECVKLILPWSTPSMRFCTSELKTDIICRALIKQFPGSKIVSVSGIRRQESRERAKAPIARWQPKLTSKTHKTVGIDWNAIIEWSLDDVMELHLRRGFALHPAYTQYGASRVSCLNCIFSTEKDLKAAMRAPENHPAVFRMIKLEIASTFAFQGNRWLGDVHAEWLSSPQRLALRMAKQAAEKREKAEAEIPKHLLYTKGWPTCVPTMEEAKVLADVRRRVSEAVGIIVQYAEPRAIRERYELLMRAKK
jgi:3'-phosphoadenosine 5'-phosphosulfate sulfotransferase (PAPS reductase)/FAD synthetase